MAISHHASTFVKLLKLLINVVVLVLYRNGDEGYFMGSSYNKNHDAEALASGVFIGFLIYNFAGLIAAFVDSKSGNQSITEGLMNFTGAVLWVTTGGVVLQFWLRFIPANHFTETNPSAVGIAMGCLCVINAAVYLADTVLSYANYRSLE
ncbi:protein snakeskin [Folsomia candida]|uniref:Uncharacterized protein n=1 Tax=Folsomia candida TaxID=158441 RepID=A0A226E208_FOLCA|nr:protein snakeskin [Folsomia candida]OXA51064.1 hypothetical protein Fcan01_14674 [Folsomia candida]